MRGFISEENVHSQVLIYTTCNGRGRYILAPEGGHRGYVEEKMSVQGSRGPADDSQLECGLQAFTESDSMKLCRGKKMSVLGSGGPEDKQHLSLGL